MASARNSRPLSSAAAAERIVTEMTGLAAAIADRQARAERDERAAMQERIHRIVARVPAKDRDRIAAVVLAMGSDLGGFDVAGANETSGHPSTLVDTESDEAEEEPEIPARLLETPPAAAPVIEVDHATRTTRRR